MLDDNYTSNLLESFTNGDTVQCDTVQCYFNVTPPEMLDWKTAYNTDKDTIFIMSKLVSSEKIDWKNEDLTPINRAYRSPLQDNRIQIVNKKLVLFKPILANHRHVMLIIVPSPIRRQLFSHYHAGPTCGHMGE